MESAQHTAVRIENTGRNPITLLVRKPNFITWILDHVSKNRRKAIRAQRDIECINKNAEYLNKGTEENLEFQVDIWGDE